ncbi:MAG: PQQ-binding-like beta-propeller repeat protein, partial [Planctomycetia bacterium]|nr:PQQ-binding-like beta-propeller repeat protein [Planctomycetia bacterium]
ASHDGRLLAASSLDGTVQIFDAAEGRRLHVIVSRVAPTELAFSPIGDLLAIAGADGPVTLWHAETGAQASVLVETAAPIAFSRDGKLIAGRAARQEIALWDAQTGELRRTMQGHASGDLRGITFSDDGRMLASFGTDVSVLLWDVASGQERRRFPNAQHPAFSPDGAFLAAGTSAGDLVLWDTRTGETQRTFDEGGYPLAFREQGKSIVSKRLGRAILWSLESGEEIRTLVDVPELAAVSSGGTWLAGCDAAVGELRLWNLEAGTGVRVLNTAGPLAALAFTADGDSLLTGSKTGVVQFWSNEKAAERVASPIRLGPADLSPDGRWLAARSGDRIELVDVSTGNSERTIGSGTSELDSLAFSPDGRLLAGFGGWGFFRTSLRLWDPRASRELTLEDKLAGTVRSIAFSSDSQLLAIAGDSRLVTIWHMVRRKVQYDLDDSTDRVTALAFHPDGRRLAAACIDQSVVLWDLKAEAGKPFAKAGAVCRELVFSPDGEFLAAPAGERVVVWNVDSGKIAAELSTAAGSPSTFAWHPAGTALAAVGNEGCVWLWNEPQSRRFREEPDRVVVLGPPRGIVHRVLWSPDGRHLVTVNGNGTIAVLRLSTEY